MHQGKQEATKTAWGLGLPQNPILPTLMLTMTTHSKLDTQGDLLLTSLFTAWQ